MDRKPVIIRFFIILICLIVLVPIHVSFADANDQGTIKKEPPASLGTVNLKSNVTAELKNLQAMTSGKQQVVSFTLNVQNGSNTAVNFIDYWVEVRTASGAKLSVQLDSQAQKNIPAKTSRDFTFIAKAENGIELKDLIIQVIEWDFDAPDHKRVLAEIKVPESYQPVTPAGIGRLLSLGDVETSLYVKQAVIGRSDQYYKPDVRMVLKNEGKSTVELPDIKFFIQTSEGLIYPLQASGIKGTTLDPLMEKEFQMTASIPIQVSEQGWRIVVAIPFNEGKEHISVAQFELPKADLQTGSDLEKYYTFTNAHGVYDVKLNAIHRLPIEDEDLVASNLTIRNSSDQSLPVPDLAAKYILDDKIEVSALVINSNKMIALQPGQSMDVQVTGRIPYTYDVSKVQLILQEKDTANNSTLDLISFTHAGPFAQIPQIRWGEDIKITDIGYRSSLKFRDVMVFKGSGADILAAQILVTNEEKRAAEILPLAGYFEKEDGTVYNATIQLLSEKVSPSGNALLYAWAAVPKDADLSGVRVVIGKAVTESAPPSSENNNPKTSIAAYVTPYKAPLGAEKAAQQGMQNIDIYPYKLSIKRVRTQMDFLNAKVSFDFDYTLERDLLTKVDMKDHRIVIELEDTDDNVKFSRELEIKESTSGSADDAALVTGSHTLQLQPWTDYEIVMNMNTLKDYNLNVYYQIQPGHRKLLASETIPWLVNRSLR